MEILKNKLKNIAKPRVSMLNIKEIQDDENNEENLTINKLKFSKTPRRPNLISIEEPQTLNPHSFDSQSIYEWNIDGFSVGQKMQIILKMQMYANALRQVGNTELAITKLITSGFTGQLGDWWGTYLTDEQIRLIEQNVQKDEQGEIIFMADGEPINDSVTSLLFNIGRQFIGRYPRYEQNLRDYLINLKCRSMTQYSEYHDYFMNVIYKMADSAK